MIKGTLGRHSDSINLRGGLDGLLPSRLVGSLNVVAGLLRHECDGTRVTFQLAKPNSKF